MRKIKRLLFAVLMMTCSVSWAEWEFTGDQLEGKISIYHDRSTIRRNGVIAKMWIMIDFSTVQISSGGERYKSSKGLTAYNCEKETYANISIILNSGSMGKGEVVWSHTRKESEWEWDPNPPRSVSEVTWKIACGKQ
jgi:hypothetical protein